MDLVNDTNRRIEELWISIRDSVYQPTVDIEIRIHKGYCESILIESILIERITYYGDHIIRESHNIEIHNWAINNFNPDS